LNAVQSHRDRLNFSITIIKNMDSVILISLCLAFVLVSLVVIEYAARPVDPKWRRRHHFHPYQYHDGHHGNPHGRYYY